MPSLLLLVFLIQAWPMRLQADRNIFILAGQSNMAGRGGVVNDTATGVATWDGVVPPQCRPNPSILKLNAQLKWVEAREPLHEDIDAKKTNGIGPGMVFANSVLHKHHGLGVVGLVPCAIGGTNIGQWEKGKVLYNHMMRRVKASMRDGGTIRALLWFQGETDTVNLSDAQSYQTRVHKFFLDVRDDLQSPLLPIIQVALASGSGPYMDIVRQAQLSIDLLNLKTVDAQGLPLEPDGLHLSTPAQVDLGQRMADGFLQFVPTSSPNIYNNNVSPIRNEASGSIRLYNCVSGTEWIRCSSCTCSRDLGRPLDLIQQLRSRTDLNCWIKSNGRPRSLLQVQLLQRIRVRSGMSHGLLVYKTLVAL